MPKKFELRVADGATDPELPRRDIWLFKNDDWVGVYVRIDGSVYNPVRFYEDGRLIARDESNNWKLVLEGWE